MTSPSDLTPRAATPDPALLTAVAGAVDQAQARYEAEGHEPGPDTPGWVYDEAGENCLDSPLARAALAAAGRVLAERLRAEADGHADEVQRITYGAGASALTPGLLLGANLLARWCGTEPEGASDGA